MHKPDAPAWATEWVRRIQMTKLHGVDDLIKRTESEIAGRRHAIEFWTKEIAMLKESLVRVKTEIEEKEHYLFYLERSKSRGEK